MNYRRASRRFRLYAKWYLSMNQKARQSALGLWALEQAQKYQRMVKDLDTALVNSKPIQ